jgi:hypothetical protein
MRLSFVHLDLDLYDSTLAALEWFWPRLEKGGSSTYVRAFTLSGNQCLAVKA